MACQTPRVAVSVELEEVIAMSAGVSVTFAGVTSGTIIREVTVLGCSATVCPLTRENLAREDTGMDGRPIAGYTWQNQGGHGHAQSVSWNEPVS